MFDWCCLACWCCLRGYEPEAPLAQHDSIPSILLIPLRLLCSFSSSLLISSTSSTSLPPLIKEKINWRRGCNERSSSWLVAQGNWNGSNSRIAEMKCYRGRGPPAITHLLMKQKQPTTIQEHEDCMKMKEQASLLHSINSFDLASFPFRQNKELISFNY